MCGIVTLATSSSHAPVSRRSAEQVASSLKHRGPDGIRSWLSNDGHVAMAHARLSIIDLEGGWQPLIDESGAALCYNGEIYNYRELRRELETLGSKFHTQSDSEVLLKALIAWGAGALGRLRGIFAFTFYDPRDRSLLLVRDHLGIKPLYFEDREGRLAVASELRALAIHSDHEPKIDQHGLVHYTAIGYVLAPRTILSGISQLLPGSYAYWRNGKLEPAVRYFDLATAANSRSHATLSHDEIDARAESLIEKAVRSQLVSDVPVGVFLSGGVDSSLVAKFSSLASTSRLLAFTADFDEKEFSELDAAAFAARECNLDQVVIPIRSLELVEKLKELPAATDAPIFDPSFIPTYFLCRETSRQVRVVLSGDGGDELFLGYPTYVADRLAQRMKPARFAQPFLNAVASALPARFGKVTFDYKAKAFARSFAAPAAEAHCGWREILDPHALLSLFDGNHELVDSSHPRRAFQSALDKVPDAEPLTALSYVDTETWLTNDILVKSDRAGMAHGLEVRVPLLDVDLAEFALALPDDSKMPGFNKKRVLKSVLAKHFPAHHSQRAKKGFSAPISDWLCSHMNKELRELPSRVHEIAGLSSSEVSRLVESHLARRIDNGMILWALTTLTLWHDSIEASRRSA